MAENEETTLLNMLNVNLIFFLKFTLQINIMEVKHPDSCCESFPTQYINFFH